MQTGSLLPTSIVISQVGHRSVIYSKASGLCSVPSDSNLEMHHRLEGTIDAKIAFFSLHWGAGEFFSLMRI
jgi:hypothetical protein